MALFGGNRLNRGVVICSSNNRLDGKTVIITGGTCGIGKETARELVSRGARVILGCRNVQQGKDVAFEISQIDQYRRDAVDVRELDLSSMKCIRRFAADVLENEPRIDILINNAGLMFHPKTKTKDGFEIHFGVNHLGHFLLTHLFLNKLRECAPSRIINITCSSHKFGCINFDDLQMRNRYKPEKAYAQSKLANVLFTAELAKHLKGTGISVYAVNPGLTRTALWRHSRQAFPLAGRIFSELSGSFMLTAIEAAQTPVYCAVANIQQECGFYYENCMIRSPSARAMDEVAAVKLWNVSRDLTGTKHLEIA